MGKGPVSKKDIIIETSYYYMNLHLQLLNLAILNKQYNEIEFQKSQLRKIRDRLLKLGYFERKI